jgi:3-oxoacyl-[acyl-carrier protein] reductase
MAGNTLAGKTVLITGANRGLGWEMADAVAGEGANVVMLATHANDLADSVSKIEGTHGAGRAIGIVTDVGDDDSARTTVAEARARFGTIDVLINNAAIGPDVTSADYKSAPAKFWEVEGAIWRRMLVVNAYGPQLMAQLVVPEMLRRGWGRIINITTSLDTMYMIDGGAYGPSKAALEAHTVVMARHLEGSGVTANVLVPGGLADTRIVPPSVRKAGAPIIPAAIMRAPAIWLASAASDDINGMRFIALRWDDALPIDERIAAAGAPAAWPQLGAQAIDPPR